MLQFTVLVRYDPEVGEWLSHCLNWDLVATGNSPDHAVAMMAETIDLAIEEDERQGFDPNDRPAAPQEYWDLLEQVRRKGTPPSQRDRNGEGKGVLLVAVMWRATTRELRALEGHIRQVPAPPPAWMIASFQDTDHHIPN